MEDIPNFKPRVHLFVCINDRTGTGSPTPSCGPRIRVENVKEIKRWIQENGLTSQVYCTAARCLGFCNPEGSVAVVYPKGRFIRGIQNVEDLKKIILEEVEGEI